jgi:hypothetical protein
MALFLSVIWALAAGANFAHAASDQASVKRGEPQREGRAWVEHADCSAPARDGGRLVLRADFGSITVRPGQSGRVGCQVRLQAYTPGAPEANRYFRSLELSLRTAEGTIYLTSRSASERHRGMNLSAEFFITVPPRFNLDLETRGGDIAVERLGGELRASTAGGDIRAGDLTGPVKVETAGGNIALGNMGQRLEASTAGGNIRVGNVKGNASLDTSGGEIAAGLIEGTVTAQTAGGDIALRGATGSVVAETAGGQIQIGDCGSSVHAQTAGGNIRLQGARGIVKVETAGGSIDMFQLQSAVRAATAAGRILAEISASRQTFANSNLQTSVGDVQVFLPVDLPLNINAVIDEAAGHKIISDFPLTVQGVPQGEDDQDFGTRTVRGKCALNGGGKELVIHTVMGNIEIHKLDSAALNQLKTRQAAYWSNWQLRENKRVEQELQRVGRKLQLQMERQQREIQLQMDRQQRKMQLQEQEIQKRMQEDDDED